MKKILMIKNFPFLILVCMLVTLGQPALAQKRKKNKKAQIEIVVDTLPKVVETEEEEKKSPFKDYSEIVTEDAVSDSGLFIIHQVESKYYYEIPFSLLDKDMLLVSRISKVAGGLSNVGLSAGSKTNEQLIRWKRVNNSIHLQSISFGNVANDSLPIAQSVIDNNYHPILAAFKIESINPDSTAAVINVGSLFLKDVKALTGLSERVRKKYKVKSLDEKRSFISRWASYPENIEVRHDMTFVASAPPSNFRSATISLQMSQSMYLLPEEQMQPRLFDKRVGWFTMSQVDYGSDALKADKKTYIKRWKLIPKDIAAYNRGELVEPIKPIVYYLDPATPEKWRPYFRQGIEDWQTAFEAAGFKHAIIAKDPPCKEEDPDWSPEDARYSTVRYVASLTRNAMGPSVSDPRTGEILESDILWYHNHLRSYRNRYLLETGAANPAARTLNTPDADIGEMIRMVISHEVGHTLGLPHNMKASHAYPTDSLRSPSFTQKWGLATTLMDYTRYNYVAQPGDGNVRWVRMLGPYDNYAINWGYRYISPANSAAEETPTLNSWINEKDGDPVYLFGARNSYDPSSQTECVGDDAVKASSYGLSNLKIVAKNLVDWTTTKDKGYDDLEELYGELNNVWSMYCSHVTANIGGVYEKLKTADQPGFIYTPTPKIDQQRAMTFLVNNVFTTPHWLLQKEIVANIGPSGVVDGVRKLHVRQMKNVLRKSRLQRLIDQEATEGANAYTLTIMLGELRKGLWSELVTKKPIDSYRRNVQRAHIETLASLLNGESENRSDIAPATRAELVAIKSSIKKSLPKYGIGIVKYHLLDMVEVIDDVLDVD